TLATETDADRWNQARIVVQAIGSSERKTIITGGADARYFNTGHILYTLGGELLGERFDLRKLETVGGAIPLVEGGGRALNNETGAAHFSVSDTGSLMYLPGSATASQMGFDVALLDRKGTVERLNLPQHRYDSPRFSPDGQQLAVGIDDGGGANIWVY